MVDKEKPIGKHDELQLISDSQKKLETSPVSTTEILEEPKLLTYEEIITTYGREPFEEVGKFLSEAFEGSESFQRDRLASIVTAKGVSYRSFKDERKMAHKIAKLVEKINGKPESILGQKKFSEGRSLLVEKKIIKIIKEGEEELIVFSPELKNDSRYQIAQSVIEIFKEHRLLNESEKGNVRLSQKGEIRGALGYWALRRASIAEQILLKDEGLEVKSLKEVANIYKREKKEIAIQEIGIDLDKKESAQILYISQALFGDKDFDVALAKRVVDQISKLPKSMKPDIVVLSGLLPGRFKYRNKSRRDSLLPNFRTMNNQFAAAHVFIREISDKISPKKIIYNLGDDDQEIAFEYALERINTQVGNLKQEHIPYWKMDQMASGGMGRVLDREKKFQNNVVLPYQMLMGRRLLSAEEMREKYGILIEEYEVIKECVSSLSSGVAVKEKFYKDLINLKLLQKIINNDYTDLPVLITDDVNLRIKTRNNQLTTSVKYRLNFSPAPLYQDPSTASETFLGLLQAAGQEIPQMLVNQNQEIGVGIQVGEDKEGNPAWLTLTPGMTKINFDQKGSSLRAKNGPWRQLTTRRFYPTPAAISHEVTDDGRFLVTPHNGTLYDKMSSSSKRAVVAFNVDWQAGSVTHRPDYAIKYGDMLKDRLRDADEGHLFFGGDIGQMWNYPTFAQENARMGLVGTSRQEKFIYEGLKKQYHDFPRSVVEKLKSVDIVIGNHEWNSGYKYSGDTHAEYLRNLFQLIYSEKGLYIKDQNYPVTFHENISVEDGSNFLFWAAKKDIAGYGLKVQHMILEKGAKGGDGKAPIYAAISYAKGLGKYVGDEDAMVTGHWHVPQYLLLGDKLVLISGSLAQTSGYEYVRGHVPKPGAIFLHLGGGVPPVAEFISAKTLKNHEIKDGYYSKEGLADHGFLTDEGFDPKKHGFALGQPQSALQKALWAETFGINWDVHSRFKLK